MAKSKVHRVCRNVGELREFIKDLPDKMPIVSSFGDRIEFLVFEKDSCERGPQKYLSVSEAE